MDVQQDRRRVDLGKLMITGNALRELHPEDVQNAVRRHARGDWGELDDHDRTVNEDALRSGGRLLSVYRDRNGTRMYVITEWDRSLTTVLLPEDY